MTRTCVARATSAIRAGRLTQRIGIMLLGAMVTAIVTGGAAQAQSDTKPNAQVREACTADIRTLCAGVMPGGGRVKQCMVEKHDQLSQGCKSALLAARSASGK